MRAAAKVAGITVSNSTGLRGLPSLSPAEHPFATATRKAARPASSIVSSSDKVNDAFKHRRFTLTGQSKPFCINLIC